MLSVELIALLEGHRVNDVKVQVRLEGHGDGDVWTEVEGVKYEPEHDRIVILVSPVLVPAYDAHTLLEVAEECGVLEGLYLALRSRFGDV